ncbi:poly(R)-hydroxyalkanoic acid synthase, class III, PhaE subunit [Pleurocapsa sp. PCC 7327]|uniref:class III poly(R)-hydroxyalkanoic acid synthase subunit PhaE n=1 Tax=Pleurocapsa sp. PCC 7327 TaxID=118163 RepID=UPI00029FB30F|nr:class III poly(R)-hydroxyalkanoic acid synthase subunit PhaE [Pleurocapsa sp. PCC 7327]AFY79159.1 poly(R)-hydroxyalkanoic acid synthase, class III, PhaE subunit [Pleurocapsa sp. PCC 7327]
MVETTNHWSEMTNDLVRAWADTGTQMWKSWFNLMGLAPTAETVADAKPAFKYVAQRFVDNQDLFVRFLRLSYKAWTDIFPKVESGEDWQQTLSKYTEQIRQQFDQFFTGTLRVSQDTAQLWQLYLKETQKFNQLWASALLSSSGLISKTVTGTSTPWIELNNLYWNLLYEETFGSLMQSPILGPTREFNGKLVRAFDAWTDLYQATINYQIVLANVQIRSFEQLMRELVSLAEKGKTVKNWREFQDIWSQVADDVFAQAFCDEENLKIRGKFLNSLNTYRLQQQELLELWMKLAGMPVRSEVDEMHKNIYELRKEVKNLKKTLARYEASDRENQEVLKELKALKQTLLAYESSEPPTQPQAQD